jgi:hypothetical protein
MNISWVMLYGLYLEKIQLHSCVEEEPLELGCIRPTTQEEFWKTQK